MTALWAAGSADLGSWQLSTCLCQLLLGPGLPGDQLLPVGAQLGQQLPGPGLVGLPRLPGAGLRPAGGSRPATAPAWGPLLLQRLVRGTQDVWVRCGSLLSGWPGSGGALFACMRRSGGLAVEADQR